MRILRLAVAIVLVFVVGSSPARAALEDSEQPSWTQATWLTATDEVTAMAWAPDGSGRLFLADKGGEIRIAKVGPPPTLLVTPFATVTPLYTNAECGLEGIAFDPNFLENGYVYVFATVSASEQQIIRYTAVGDTGTNKTVVLAGLPSGGGIHNGGGLAFGRDARLYWTIGDNGNNAGIDADLASLGAKAGRANPDGSVPADNPFVDGPGGNNDYVFARGFRNPYTATFQPATGTLWVFVVGNNYEQIFAVGSGDHAGWLQYENTQPAGFIPPKIKYRTNGTDTRNLAGAVRSANVATYTTTVAHGFRQGELVGIGNTDDPSFTSSNDYILSTPTPTTFTLPSVGPDAFTANGIVSSRHHGGCVTGGIFYDASGAPAAYRGNLFHGDFNSGRTLRALVGPGTTVTQARYFAKQNNLQLPIDMAVGPDGALYSVGHFGQIYRTSYDAATQGIVISELHPWLVEGGSRALTVRLALAPAANVTVTVAHAGGSTDVGLTEGASLTFTPANFSVPQRVVLAAAEDLDLLDDSATYDVASAGLPTESVEVYVADVSGAAGGATPGQVGDGIADSPLRLSRNPSPSLLNLTWSASCGGTASDYSIHEGALGTWYSHQAIACSTGGATAATITPAAGSCYYLVVPLDATREGSYGTRTGGAERPMSDRRCRLQRDVTSCP